MYFQNSFPHFFSSFPSLKFFFFLLISLLPGEKMFQGFFWLTAHIFVRHNLTSFFLAFIFFQTSVLTSSCMPSSGDSRLVSGNAVSPTLAATPLLRCTKLFTFLFTLAQRPPPPPGDMDDPVGVGVDPVGEHRPGGTPCSW